MQRISILIVLASIAAALGWDVLILALGVKGSTWCQAVRDLNRDSNGLLMFCALGVAIHIFCVQWFPAAWTSRPNP
jgi:hypothetical protein